ncbi:3-dehydroquinate synthase [soil metagenome]
MLPSNLIITNDLNSSLKDLFSKKKYSKTGLLMDENTFHHCYPQVQQFLPDHYILKISSGEENKNIQNCLKIWNFLTKNKFDRKSLLINLGGGVIGDMGGFCAATFKRGIDFINLPTTLLAQVDASIGGKLGIDFEGFKNHIGLFKDPEAIVIYTPFLNSLDFRQIRSGFAEVIKHSLIADAQAWPTITSKDLQDQDWDPLVRHSVEIKNKVVQEDPLEKGLRKILNFGHTIGHAIETFFLDQEEILLHGEAISIGMICEAYLSNKLSSLKKVELHDIETFLIKTYGKTEIPREAIKIIAGFTLQDKKNENTDINCTLLESPGKAIYDQKISTEDVMEAIEYYKKRVD